MSKLVYCCLVLFVTSCGPGWSEYSEEIAEGYVWENEGDGFNAISSKVSGVNTLLHLRKYYHNGQYICVWQADSARLASPNFRLVDLKNNAYDPTDRFYIIDVEKKKQFGPFRKEEFFAQADSLHIDVSWEPVTR